MVADLVFHSSGLAGVVCENVMTDGTQWIPASKRQLMALERDYHMN
jgi:hypothetical protein